MMNSRETYLRLLLCVALADDYVTPSEAEMLEAAAVQAGLGQERIDELKRAFQSGASLDKEKEFQSIPRQIEPGMLLETLKDGYLLAMSDGDLAPVEVAVLDDYMAHVGLGSAQRAALHEWARTAAEHTVVGIDVVTHAMAQREEPGAA